MVKTGRGNSHKEAQQKRQAIGKQLKTDDQLHNKFLILDTLRH